MTDTSFIENEDRQALRKAVAAWASNYGHEYYLHKARAHEHTDRIVVRGRQTRLPRGEPARGVRRRRRRACTNCRW